MPKDRSPSYPHIALEIAIRKARSVHHVCGTRVTSRREVTRAMGHSSAIHWSHIAALRAYALLQGRADHVRLTEHAIIIAELAEEPRHPERVRAIRLAAFSPEIFDDMRRYLGEGDSPPSTSCYRWLRQRNFSHRGATRVLNIYESNVEFLNDLAGASAVVKRVFAFRTDRRQGRKQSFRMTTPEFLARLAEVSGQFDWALNEDTRHRPERRASARFQLRASPKFGAALPLGPLRAVAFAHTGNVPDTWADAAMVLGMKISDAAAVAAAANDRTWNGYSGRGVPAQALLDLRNSLLTAVGVGPAPIRGPEPADA